jgi:predicted AAA+ superfamily ATPase
VPSTYLPRIIEKRVALALTTVGAVVLEGPRACGKTSTARRFAASEALLDTDENLRAAARIDPSLVLHGAVPRLLDEWQSVPGLWNHVRRAVDDRGDPGQFLLTGSAVPTDDENRHSGAGRIERLRMRPLSLFEAGIASGEVSLGDLLDGGQARASDRGLGLADLIDAVVRGGWPRFATASVLSAARAIRAYIDEIRRVDLQRIDGRERDPERVGRLLRSLARHTATCADVTTLAADTGGSEGPLHWETVRDYLSALERVHLLDDQPAWAPHLRSRARLRSAPKRHFSDPSLAVAALGAGPADLLADLEFFGFLFESLVIRDLRTYADAHEAEVLHYRDGYGKEVDAIVRTRDGRWLAVEVKLGTQQVDEAADSLRRFRDQVETARSGEPAGLVVVTGRGLAYTRPDGVRVVPIGTLGP